MPLHPLRAALLAVAAALGVALAAAPAAAQTGEPRLPVVATFSIVGDFVRQVGGERVVLTTLVGPNGDAHVYAPTPADAKAVASARLVFVNGLGFEGWLDRLVKASGTKAPVVVSTKGIEPRSAEDDDDDHGHGKGKARHTAEDDHGKGKGKPAKAHDHGAADPHAWQDIANAKRYVANIRDALIAADPTGKAAYETNATAYIEKLDALEADVRERLAAIPAPARRVITSHDAFGYFGAAYRVEFLAPQGISTEAEATARQVARLIRQIKTENVKAIFVENISDPRLVKRIADEAKVTLGGELFSDSLSPPGGPAATYLEMVRHNVSALVAGMTGS